MLARPCKCPKPLVFDDADTCTRCGHDIPVHVTASTRRLALAIAAVMVHLPKRDI